MVLIDMTNLSKFDLKLLRVLDALLIEQSTVKAGERLGLSQPAVSGALGRLRLSLKDELFFRSGQKLEATEFALSLQESLQEILSRIEALIGKPKAGSSPLRCKHFCVFFRKFSNILYLLIRLEIIKGRNPLKKRLGGLGHHLTMLQCPSVSAERIASAQLFFTTEYQDRL